MHRLVFFGMNGGYSAASLHALARAGLKPVLVVRGLAKLPGIKAPTLDYAPVKRPLLERLKTRIRGGPADSSLAAKIPEATTELDHAAGEAELHDKDLAAAARMLDVDVLTTTDANALRARARIANAEPDAFVIAGFPHLLSRELLSLAKKGGLNLHPGRLPAERGPSPLFWALREGRTEIGFTLHVLDEGEDSGDIVSTGELRFEPGLDGEVILTRCARLASPQLVRAVRGLLEGDLVRAPQPREGRGRCPRPTFRDGRVDPAKSARQIFTFVAGCARTHSIFVECGGDRFFIKEAASFDEEAKLPFEYVLTGDRLLLRASPGVVELVLKEQGALFTAEYTES